MNGVDYKSKQFRIELEKMEKLVKKYMKSKGKI